MASFDFTGTFTGTCRLWLHHLVEKQQVKTGAGGGTRTHTTFYGPRILSPVRLPFRHTGIIDYEEFTNDLNAPT